MCWKYCDAGESAAKIRGAGGSAGEGAAPHSFPRKTPSQHLCQHSSSTPRIFAALFPAPSPAIFWGSPSLYSVAGRPVPKFRGTINKLLGSGFGRTDFPRFFVFGPPDFFADLLAGFFLLIFVGKKWPEKSSRKIPGKILQNLYNKNPPTHFCRLAGAKIEDHPHPQ